MAGQLCSVRMSESCTRTLLIALTSEQTRCPGRIIGREALLMRCLTFSGLRHPVNFDPWKTRQLNDSVKFNEALIQNWECWPHWLWISLKLIRSLNCYKSPFVPPAGCGYWKITRKRNQIIMSGSGGRKVNLLKFHGLQGRAESRLDCLN